jgi:hypothetical protein
MFNLSKLKCAKRMTWQLLAFAILCMACVEASFASTNTVIARPSATLNGWGPNAHLGAYEEGVNQGFGWGLNNDTTYPYTNVSNATDTSTTTYAYSGMQHTHKYAGCVYTFPAVTPTGRARFLKIDSQVPPSGTDGFIVTQRSAGIWYSINGGSTWTQIYNTASRARTVDSIALSSTQNLAQLQVMVFADSHDDMYHKVFDINVTEVVNTVTGYINPKYVVLGVTYAPPGPSSNVTYTNSTLVGSTVTTTDSFGTGVNVSVSTTNANSTKIDSWGIVGSIAVENTTSQSTDFSQTVTNTNAFTVSKQSTVSYLTAGTGDAFNPVNHDYDTIWLWLNPLLIYTIDQDVPTNVVWNGYGYDNHDINGIDKFGVQVGWLNGHFGSNPSINAVLARSWVTANEPTLVWPAGQGPGITSTDITNILQADPFTSGTYVLPTPLPTTSADHRFTQVLFPPNPVNYVQSGPGNGGGTTTLYNTVNVNSSTVGQGTMQKFTQTFGVEQKLSTTIFMSTMTTDLKVSTSISLTHGLESSLTTTQTQTNALSVTGPGCPQTSPPCNPTYGGPGEFIVFQDNQYGTFMFYPGN